MGYLDDGGGGEREGRLGDGVGEDEIVGEIGTDSALKALQTHFFFFHFQPVQSRGLNWIWTTQGHCSLVGWLVRSGTPSSFLRPDSRVSLFYGLPDRSTYSHSRTCIPRRPCHKTTFLIGVVVLLVLVYTVMSVRLGNQVQHSTTTKVL